MTPPHVPPQERPPEVIPVTPPPIGGQLPSPAGFGIGLGVVGGFLGPPTGPGTGDGGATEPGTTLVRAPGAGGPPSHLTITPIASPRFREVGVAIGDAVDVSASGPVSFPLTLTLTYDPLEPQFKGVPPELIRAYFFDGPTGTWSTEGLEVTGINVSDGVVAFNTTHLTVFRLGVPRGRPPSLHQARPQAVGPGGSFGVWGRGFSLPAAQNVLTIGGSFVGLALDAAGMPQPFAFNDEGDTLTLRDAQGLQLDQAQLQPPPDSRASWTRQADGDAASPFILHTDAASGRLFSPGTRANGDPFTVTRGHLAQPPAPGDLLINEVLLVPPNSFLGDANGDGETIPEEDVFIELVNATEHPLELGGCQLLTQNSGERHRFPAGTILPGGMAFVLFGVDDPAHPPQPAGPFGGERVFPDLSGEKRLIARAPSDVSPGTDFVQATTFRQTSNPMTFQFLTPLGERVPAFDHQSQALGPIALLPLRMLRLGDLDRDLDLDLAALTGSADVVLGLNDGFGAFADVSGRVSLPGGLSRFFDMALADLTEDGAPDLILGDTNQSGSYTQLLVYHNNGGGHFQLESQQGVLNSPASSGPSALAAGDVDDDGDLDVVVAMIGDQPIFFRNDGASHFSHLPGLDVLPQSQVVVPTDLVLADVDGDGDLDVLLSAGRAGLGGFSDVQLFINQGGGQFTEETASRLPVRSEGIESLAIGDVDGDLALDIAASGLLTAPRLYHNNGSGMFTLADASAFASARAATVLLEDLDGDKDLDLVFSQSPRDLVYLNDGAGVFSALAPLPEVSGAHLEVAASDVDNDGDLDLLGVGSLTLLLNTGTRANHPPTIDAVADQPVIEGDPLVVNVMAHDIDDDSLTLEASLASGQPLSTIGASFTDHGAGQGTVNWTPGFDQGLLGGKLYEVVVKADDGLTTGSRTIRMFVHNFNHAPTLTTIAPRTVDELEPMFIQLQAQDEDIGDVLTFGSVNRPSGSSLNSTSGLFEWTPGPTQGDDPQGFLDYSVRFTVTDLAGATVPQDAAIRVVHRNHAPEFADVDPLTVAEGQTLVLRLVVTDPDGDQPTVTELELPTGADFDGPTRTFTWTPDFTQARADPYIARFEATDQEQLSTQLAVAITVLNTHVNQPPVLGALSDQTVLEGHLLQFAFPVSDADGDQLTVQVTPLPRGARVFQQGAVWLFQWVPGADQSGAYPVAAEVSDGIISSPVIRNLTITVIENPGLQRLVAQVGFMTDGGDAALHDVFHAQQAQQEASFHAAQEAEETAFRAAADTAHQAFHAGLESMHAAEHTDLDELRQQLLSELLTGDPATDAVVRAFVEQFITGAHDQGVHAALEALHTFGHSDDPARDAEFHAMIDSIHQAFHDDIASGAIADELHAFVHTSTSAVIESAVTAALTNAVDAYHTGGIHAAMAVLDAAVDAALAAAYEAFRVQQQGAHDAAHAEQAAAHTAFHTANASGSSGLPFGDASFITWGPGSDLIMDLGEVHPALVSSIDVFHSEPAMGLSEADLSLWVSEDNVTYQSYAGPKAVSASGNRLMISNLNITQRYIKIHRLPSSDPQVEVANFLPEIVRASGAILLDGPTTAFLDDLAHKTFLYFANHVSANGLIPDRVAVSGGQAFPGAVFSTGATGFWLAALPIAAERGWMTQVEAQNAARRTLEFYLGDQGGPVEGHLGFFHHFLNADGTQFTGFGDDGVSTIDSSILFMGALACGEYFRGNIETLATRLVGQANWDGFYDHNMNLLHQIWTPALGFGRHIDYTSEGILAYLLAAGSTTHPIASDPDLPGGGADAYYAYSRGNYGRILGRFGRDGRPLLQSFFGSLFTYLYPSLLLDASGVRDAFYFNWEENTREAILANFRFAQNHLEVGYSRLYWGLSASDGPDGYQGLYGAPPLDPGAGAAVHDGTVAPYAVAGALAYTADLALPALQHLASMQNGRLSDIYGLKSGVNVLQDFFDNEYLGIDQGALLLGLERYRTGQVAQLVRQSPVMQQALAALGLQPAPHLPLSISGPRNQHAYLLIDTSEHLTQTVQVARPALPVSGDLLLELHPFGMDNARGDRFVDVELRVNGQFLKTVRFLDRRGTGVVDVGSIYVAVNPSLLAQDMNTIEFLWVGGERWVQLQDVELSGPTGRKGTQEFWQIGQPNVSFEFGDERRVNDSYLVGDNLTTLEQAVNVVDEPVTDILFELEDVAVDRRLRVVADDTHNGMAVTVEVSVNDAVVGTATLHPDEEGTVDISHMLLRAGWNHLRLRHANVPNQGEWILWDLLALEPQPGAGALQVLLRNVQGDQLAPQIQFSLAPPDGAVMSALQYLEIHYSLDEVADRVTLSTDNRNAPIHRFTGPESESAAGLVGEVDSTIRVPLLWQVYDTTQPSAPAFSGEIEWAYIPDASDADFTTPGAVNYRTLASPSGLGDRPSPGRSGSSPIFVYLTADLRGKRSQPYGTDRLLIEIVQQ